MTLFINCCPRKDSRTKRLADAVLSKYGPYTEINLYQTDIAPLNENSLTERNSLIDTGKFDDERFALARQFATADEIIVAAPFWDYSFPSKLKIYLENIYVVGIVSYYNEEGRPVGLCHAKSLTYVTTAGGMFDGRFGYEYVKALCQNCFGIQAIKLIKAEMLDIVGNNPETILAHVINNLQNN